MNLIDEEEEAPGLTNDAVAKAQKNDPHLKGIIMELEGGKLLPEYILFEDRLHHIGRPVRRDPTERLQLVIPEELQSLVLKEYHDGMMHQGIDRT